MRYLAIIVALLATPAFSEEVKPSEPSSPVAAPTEWYIRLDQQGLNNIAQCAQELPKKIADPFLFGLDAQLKGQPALVTSIKAKP